MSLETTLYLGAAVVLGLATYLWAITKRNRELTKNIPLGIGVFETLLFGIKNPVAVFKQYDSLRNEFITAVKVWLGPRLVIGLIDPDDIEIILGSHEHLAKSKEYRFFEPWLGDGLLITKGEKWRFHRKIIAPTFHLNVLKSFVPLFNENSRAACKYMKKFDGQEFDIHEQMGKLTVDILMETAMGVKKQDQHIQGLDYATAVMKMCDIVHKRTYTVWLMLDKIYNLTKYRPMQEWLLDIIHTLTMKVIQEKKKLYATVGSPSLPEVYNQEKSNVLEEIKQSESDIGPFLKDDLDEDVGEKKRIAFLDFLLQVQKEDNALTDEEIREEVDTIMFEGHDTTSAGSSFFLSLLGIHKDVQKRVIAEVDEIFGDSDRYCTFQDTIRMKYLEQVLMESLRLYPPVLAIAREVDRDVKLSTVDAYIPKGTTVVVGIHTVHRNQKYYGPDANKFNPDNFLPENMVNRPYYAFIPFSAGPRSCVGRKYAMLKLKVLLSTILRNYTIHSTATEKDFQLKADIILKRHEGFNVKLEKRRTQLLA